MPIVRFLSDYDPVSGAVSNQIAQAQEATVVSLPSGSLTGINFDNRFKEDLKKGKIRFFYVAAKGLSFEPESGDTFIFEGSVWDIVGTTPLNPAGIPVIYTMAGRISGKVDIDSLTSAAEVVGITLPEI